MVLSLGVGQCLHDRAQPLNSFSRQTSTDGHMQQGRDIPLNSVILLTPSLNISTTMAFVHPFRAPNDLDRARHSKWNFVSDGGACVASNGSPINDIGFGTLTDVAIDLVMASSSSQA